VSKYDVIPTIYEVSVTPMIYKVSFIPMIYEVSVIEQNYKHKLVIKLIFASNLQPLCHKVRKLHDTVY